MTTIINGKNFQSKILNDLKNKVSKYSIKPCLAVILANDNPASKLYVEHKQKASLEVGIKSLLYKFDKNVTQEEIINLIKKLNEDKNINGILVQLPLFSHLDKNEILEVINPKKDVDGFHPINVGRLNSGLKPYAIPCTPKGILKIFKEYNIDVEGKKVVVIGRSNIVGKPCANLLLNNNATVIIAHSKTKNLKELTLVSDIIVSATGKSKLITKDMVKKDAVVIDVGITKQKNGKLSGDVDFDNVKDKVSYITPVIGGVGPMTIACLMENTFELFLGQNNF